MYVKSKTLKVISKSQWNQKDLKKIIKRLCTARVLI